MIEPGKEAATMTYTNVALKEKIMEMYPEIGEHQLSAGLNFDEQKNSYIVTFKRGKEVLTTHLEKKDADECMNGERGKMSLSRHSGRPVHN